MRTCVCYIAEMRDFTLVLMALALVFQPSAHAAELQIHFSAIQRLLEEQVFTQDGRKYVRGDARNRCSYAYLEKPQIAADGDHINVRARFSGRSSLDFFGRCIGLGDSFDLLIRAVPAYADGFVALRDVKVESAGHDTLYSRRVRLALATSLSRNFRYNVREDAKRIFEKKRDKASYTQELRKFDVTGIRVTPEAVVLMFDLQLAVQ